MKKLFTVAALASVAFTADFLGQHRPAALVKDGLNIVKDVKSHSYGKLIKDGVKITKELKLEDEELFFDIPTDPQGQLSLARETVRKMEILVKQYEAGLPIVKVKDPKMYNEMLVEYQDVKEKLLAMRQMMEFMEMLLGGDDNEFFATNQQDQLREMRDLLLSNESTLRELNALLPLIKEESPQLYPKCLEEYNKQKEKIAQLRKKVEEFEAAAAKAKTQTPVKSQPMRRLFAEDNEFFNLNEVEGQLREARAGLALAEKTIQEFEKELPAIKNAYPAVYAQMSDEMNKQKQKLVQARKELDELETLVKAKAKASTGTAIKFQPMGKLEADDDELFNLGELLKEGKKIRDEIKHH